MDTREWAHGRTGVDAQEHGSGRTGVDAWADRTGYGAVRYGGRTGAQEWTHGRTGVDARANYGFKFLKGLNF